MRHSTSLKERLKERCAPSFAAKTAAVRASAMSNQWMGGEEVSRDTYNNSWSSDFLPCNPLIHWCIFCTTSVQFTALNLE